MARRRRPVQAQELQQALQPQAAPVDLGPTAAPLSLPVFDFAGISRTVAGYLAERRQEGDRERQLEGERFALERPALVRDIEEDAAGKSPEEQAKFLREQFAFLQKQGLPAYADPVWQVGYARAAGRQAAERYRESLAAR